ncbi:uncharacterized protein LOC126213063 isoform X8 [Schistocerca nitens]|nr:uncharacterized protein LOC126213063 isoform X8 [Schistocerca nitens]
MDQEPSTWIKKEETDEVKTQLRFMMNARYCDVPCASVPYFMAPQAPRERNDIHQAQVYPFSMNVKEELEEGVNKESIEDPLGISWSTDFIKEDPELNLEPSVTENIVETSTRYTSDSAR